MSVRLRDAAYKAIADPVRRRMLDLLRSRERPVKELTAAFSVSQPAISQHLRELRAAGLVVSRKVSRENRYRLTAAGLGQIFGWLDRYRCVVDPAGHAWTFPRTLQKQQASGSRSRRRMPMAVAGSEPKYGVVVPCLVVADID